MSDLFAKIRHRWPVIVITAGLVTAVALATLPSSHSSKTKPTYTAQETLGITGQAPQLTPKPSTSTTTSKTPGKNNSPVTHYLALALKPEVAQTAAKIIGYKGDPARLARQIGFQANRSGQILVRAKDGSATKSAAVASAFANALIAMVVSDQHTSQADLVSSLQAQLSQLSNQITTLEKTLSVKSKPSQSDFVEGGNPDATLDAYVNAGSNHPKATPTTAKAEPTTTKPTTTTTRPAPTTTRPAPTTTTNPINGVQLNTLLKEYGDTYRNLLKAQQPQSATVAPLQVVAVKKPTLGKVSTQHPIRRRYWALGGIGAGILLGLLLATLLAFLDRSPLSVTAAEEMLGLPVLAQVELPGRRRRRPTPSILAEPTSPTSEAFRRIRTGLERLPTLFIDALDGSVRRDLDGRDPATGSRRTDGARQVLGVVGTLPRAGTTTTVANFGAALAEAGFDAVLVDANLRHPALHEWYRLPLAPGVTHGLPAAAARPTSLPIGVRVLPAGTPVSSPSAYVRSIAVQLPEWRSEAEILVLDIADVSRSNDLAELADELDGTIVVCERRRITPRRVLQYRRNLGRSGAPVIGVVVVNRQAGRIGLPGGPRFGRKDFAAGPAPVPPAAVPAAPGQTAEMPVVRTSAPATTAAPGSTVIDLADIQPGESNGAEKQEHREDPTASAFPNGT